MADIERPAGQSLAIARFGNQPFFTYQHIAAASVIAGTIVFNGALAFINSSVLQLSSSSVIVSEALLDLAAILICLRLHSPMKGLWIALAATLSFICLTVAMQSGFFDPKFFRDVLVIPLFATLGLVSNRNGLVRLVMVVQALVLGFMLYEAVSPEGFGRIFDVTQYYINTRGFEESQFWSQESASLFVSSTRPGEHFLLNSINIHRLSSIFLEPVSLGNYCVIVSMITLALWRNLSFRQRLFLVTSELLILVGCDGRFATVMIVLFVAMRSLVGVIPKYSNVVYLPVLLFMSAVATSLLGLSPEGDDFTSRTAGSIDIISNMTLGAVFGFENFHAYAVMDSGISYFLYSQSCLGVLCLWMAISFGLKQDDRPSTFFAHATCIYFAANLLISYSVFSVKTAGLLWYAFGTMAVCNENCDIDAEET